MAWLFKALEQKMRIDVEGFMFIEKKLRATNQR